jgi:hypothetical protein
MPRRAPYKHDEIDHLIHILGNDSYIGRALLDIRGNLLRGRERNKDAVFI